MSSDSLTSRSESKSKNKEKYDNKDDNNEYNNSDMDEKYDKYETYPKQNGGKGGSKNIAFHSGKGTRAKLAIYNRTQQRVNKN